MLSLLTLVAFGIVGTLLVAVQYYILQGHISGLGRIWTKSWLMFFLFTTVTLICINIINIYQLLIFLVNCLFDKCLHDCEVTIDALVSVSKCNVIRTFFVIKQIYIYFTRVSHRNKCLN